MKRRRILAWLALTAAGMLLNMPKTLSDTPCSAYIRLHVAADSDSAWDQGVKLAVRDAVRSEAAALLAGCETTEDAWPLLQDSAGQIEEAARAALLEWDPDCAASVSAGVYPFPERVYDGVTLPAGEYRAIRVSLGKGEGKNWWCVLFPSLCLPAGGDSGETVVFYSALGRWLAGLFGRDAT
ncbi:MAG: stage II sporulation protein R [Clostridia bacterium]|nr:stage II sporulation protein R [Clostridia bacterium]